MQPKASNHLRTLILGDIVGQTGLDFLEQVLPKLKKKYTPDLVIANGENITDGFGINQKDFEHLTQKLSVDVITTGNHWNDQHNTEQLFSANNKFSAKTLL